MGCCPCAFQQQPSAHATRRYLSFRRTVVCCVCGVSRCWWWGGGSFSSLPAPVIGPGTTMKPLKKQPTDLKIQLLPLLHLTSKAVIGFQPSFSARDHLTRAVFLNLSSSRTGQRGDDIEELAAAFHIQKWKSDPVFWGCGSQLGGPTCPDATTPSRRSQPTKSHCPCIPRTWTHGKGKQPSFSVLSVASVIVSSFTPPPPSACSQPIPDSQLGRSPTPQDPDSLRRANPHPVSPALSLRGAPVLQLPGR